MIGIGFGLELGQSPAAGGGGAAPSFISDNFNDNSRNATLWNLGAFYEGTTTNTGTVSETNSRLEITPVGSSVGYGGYVSASTWDVTDKSVYVNLTNTAGMSADQVAYLAMGVDADHHYTMIVTGGLLVTRRRNAGNSNLDVRAYVAANHAWLRITHRSSDGTVRFAVAPSTASNPPISADWTEIASESVVAACLVATTATVAIGSGVFSAPEVAGTVYFDGFGTGT